VSAGARDAYVTLQEAFVSDNGLRIGSRCTVLREARSYEAGWQNEWNAEMSGFIGLDGEVEEIDGESGISVRDNQTGESFYFPFFVLEVTGPPAHASRVSQRGNNGRVVTFAGHELVFDGDGATVDGDQRITYAEAQEVYSLWQRVNELTIAGESVQFENGGIRIGCTFLSPDDIDEARQLVMARRAG